MSISDIYANARGLGAYLKEKSAEIDEVWPFKLNQPSLFRVKHQTIFR